MSPLRAALSGFVSAAVFVALLTGIAALMMGCDPRGERVPDSPGPTPLTGAVRPGATCEPSGLGGAAGDGSPMVCSLDGKWRMAE